MDKQILVIDDDQDILDMVTFILTEQGYSVIASPTGEEIDNLTGNIPDLIVLDITLHGTCRNGVDICRQLKSDPPTKNVPVILLSGEKNIKTAAERCGADGYIKKPFDIDEFAKKVNTYLL